MRVRVRVRGRPAGLATIMVFDRDELTSQADVEHGCGLGRRADRRGVEAALVGLRKLLRYSGQDKTEQTEQDETRRDETVYL
jgi:hypothetical protein